MEEKNGLYFTSSHVEAILGVNRKVLLYWRKIGLLVPDQSKKSKGGHYRYSFADLVTVRAIIRLNKAGASTYRIKKAVADYKKDFPAVTSPLSEKSFFVIGKTPYVLDNHHGYNPVTKQYELIRSEELKSEVTSLTLNTFAIPDLTLTIAASRR